MQNQLQQKTIDGEKYEIGYFMSGDAHDNLIELLDIIGLSLPELFAMVGKGGSRGLNGLLSLDTDDLDLTKIGSALAATFSRMRERNATNIIRKFMDQVFHVRGADGSQGLGQVSKVFDAHFQARLFHMYKVFGAVLEVQYRDFFGALGGSQGFAARINTALGSQTSQAGNGSSSDQ